MANLLIAAQYVEAIEGEIGKLQRRLEATFAPDAYCDERLADMRIYVTQLRHELAPSTGPDAVKPNKNKEKGT